MISKAKIKHTHLYDLPAKYLPKNTKAREYLREVVRMAQSLGYTNQNAQYAAQLCAFNIRAITKTRTFKSGPEETFRVIEEFVYHYENFCFRAFCYREKLLQFVNAVLPIGYEEEEVGIKHILINPMVRQSKILPLLARFRDDKHLGKIIRDRNHLTHKLYYGETFDNFLRPQQAAHPSSKSDKDTFRRWCKDWEQEILARARLITRFEQSVYDIDHQLMERIVDFKEVAQAVRRKKNKIKVKTEKFRKENKIHG